VLSVASRGTADCLHSSIKSLGTFRMGGGCGARLPPSNWIRHARRRVCHVYLSELVTLHIRSPRPHRLTHINDGVEETCRADAITGSDQPRCSPVKCACRRRAPWAEQENPAFNGFRIG
jgi:hypothetical protein